MRLKILTWLYRGPLVLMVGVNLLTLLETTLGPFPAPDRAFLSFVVAFDALLLAFITVCMRVVDPRHLEELAKRSRLEGSQ